MFRRRLGSIETAAKAKKRLRRSRDDRVAAQVVDWQVTSSTSRQFEDEYLNPLTSIVQCIDILYFAWNQYFFFLATIFNRTYSIKIFQRGVWLLRDYLLNNFNSCKNDEIRTNNRSLAEYFSIVLRSDIRVSCITRATRVSHIYHTLTIAHKWKITIQYTFHKYYIQNTRISLLVKRRKKLVKGEYLYLFILIK